MLSSRHAIRTLWIQTAGCRRHYSSSLLQSSSPKLTAKNELSDIGIEELVNEIAGEIAAKPRAKKGSRIIDSSNLWNVKRESVAAPARSSFSSESKVVFEQENSDDAIELGQQPEGLSDVSVGSFVEIRRYLLRY